MIVGIKDEAQVHSLGQRGVSLVILNFDVLNEKLVFPGRGVYVQDLNFFSELSQPMVECNFSA